MKGQGKDVIMTSQCHSDGLTLPEHYEQLPETASPKSELIRQIVIQCGVTFQCAYGWVKQGRMPAKKEHCDTIAKLTNIPAETLFPQYRMKFLDSHE